MKKVLLSLVTMLSLFSIVKGQTELAPDQNPNYQISRAKYMQVSDSLNKWHSTTLQNTYHAIDWVADRQQAKEDRREFRQQLRMERARWSGYSYRNDGYYSPYYNNNNYYSPYNSYPYNQRRLYHRWW